MEAFAIVLNAASIMKEKKKGMIVGSWQMRTSSSYLFEYTERHLKKREFKTIEIMAIGCSVLIEKDKHHAFFFVYNTRHHEKNQL